MHSITRLLLVLALLVIARPSFAQQAYPVAGPNYGEGNRNGVISLDLNGKANVQSFAQTMTWNPVDGRWHGFGRIDYDGNGVSVHDQNAAFSIRVELVPPELEALCGPSPVPNPSYAAHVEVRSGSELVFVAGMPRNGATPGHCPLWYYATTVGHNLPETLALLKPWYRDGPSTPHARAAAPDPLIEKARAHVGIGGRWITF